MVLEPLGTEHFHGNKIKLDDKTRANIFGETKKIDGK